MSTLRKNVIIIPGANESNVGSVSKWMKIEYETWSVNGVKYVEHLWQKTIDLYIIILNGNHYIFNVI